MEIVHADHLNTPRLVADAAGTTVWRWDQAEPFGSNPADEDPDANSITFDLPLRLPGQRYDAETALHYNYFRDYDPSIGRYGESDPIGLRGGLNTYVYALAQPLGEKDPLGLEVGAADFLPEAYRMMCDGYILRKVSDWTRRIDLAQRALGPCEKKCYITCFLMIRGGDLGSCPLDGTFEIFPYNEGCKREYAINPARYGLFCRSGVITGRSDRSCCAK
ncbi:MAG: RHS repeat domain-containing protein [Nitrospiraceae bacterium]